MSLQFTVNIAQLLALLGIGFMQGLYALDAADGQADHSREVRGCFIAKAIPLIPRRGTSGGARPGAGTTPVRGSAVSCIYMLRIHRCH